MRRPIWGMVFYSALFGSIVHVFSKYMEFSRQETNILYLFTGILIFTSIFVPFLEEKIEAHNKRAKDLIEKEHAELKAKLDKEDSKQG